MNGMRQAFVALVWYPLWVLGPGAWLMDHIQPGVSLREAMMWFLAFMYGMVSPIVYFMWRESRNTQRKTT